MKYVRRLNTLVQIMLLWKNARRKITPSERRPRSFSSHKNHPESAWKIVTLQPIQIFRNYCWTQWYKTNVTEFGAFWQCLSLNWFLSTVKYVRWLEVTPLFKHFYVTKTSEGTNLLCLQNFRSNSDGPARDPPVDGRLNTPKVLERSSPSSHFSQCKH